MRPPRKRLSHHMIFQRALWLLVGVCWKGSKEVPKSVSGSDVLFIPPVHVSDVYLTEPAKWLRAMIAQHGGVQLEAA